MRETKKDVLKYFFLKKKKDLLLLIHSNINTCYPIKDM